MDRRDELLKAAAEVADEVDSLGGDAELGTWIIVYEVDYPSDNLTQIVYSAEDKRGWVQEGLLRAGIRAVDGTTRINDIPEEGEGE